MLLPTASHPRPLLPSRRCRFLWLRLSLSHELTAPNGLQLPRCSSSSAPLPAAGLRADGPLCLPSPPPPSPRPSPPAPLPRSLRWPSPRNTGGLSARPHTLGLGLCVTHGTALSGVAALASHGQDWLATLAGGTRSRMVCSFVFRANAGAGGRAGKELEKLCSEHPLAHLQRLHLAKELQSHLEGEISLPEG